MESFEWILALLLAAALLTRLARRLGAPYPTFLAVGGVLITFVPNAPQWALDPQLALTLFVAPVLLDTAYDTSLRDLRANWISVAGLVVAAVGTTTLAVALTARWFAPDMPWPIAIALGAIVSPPDAAAASAIMRQVNLPHRLLKILEGESLLNDASALLIYKLAIMAVVSGGVTFGSFAPIFMLTIFGSIALGLAAPFIWGWLVSGSNDVSTSLILQFASTFTLWIIAEALGLSGIITVVVYAMTIARRRGLDTPASMRVPIFAVWETAVFVLNAFAFVMIGLQLRPIWERLDAALRMEYATIAVAIFIVTVVARFVWVMIYNRLLYLRLKLRRGDKPVGRSGPTVASGIVVSWAGMRGIVTLAAAFAVPETLPDGRAFPYRDLMLLTAFAVVFGTLVVQGLTLKPLIAWLKLSDDNPVEREVRLARVEGYRAGIAALEGDKSFLAAMLRKEYEAAIALNESSDGSPSSDLQQGPQRRKTIDAARAKLFDLRSNGVIGDDAFHIVEQELDFAELGASVQP